MGRRWNLAARRANLEVPRHPNLHPSPIPFPRQLQRKGGTKRKQSLCETFLPSLRCLRLCLFFFSLLYKFSSHVQILLSFRTLVSHIFFACTATIPFFPSPPLFTLCLLRSLPFFLSFFLLSNSKIKYFGCFFMLTTFFVNDCLPSDCRSLCVNWFFVFVFYGGA